MLEVGPFIADFHASTRYLSTYRDFPPRRDAITLISPGTEQLNQEIFRDVVPNDNFTTVIKDFGRQQINPTSRHNDFYYSPWMYSTFASEKFVKNSA